MKGKGVFNKPIFRIAGDRSFVVQFGSDINPEVNKKVRAMALGLRNNLPPGVVEIIPTYHSLLLVYDPLITRPEKLESDIERFGNTLSQLETEPIKVVRIPVCYGGEFGPDIENVGKSSGLSTKEVIQLHCEPEYLIYMVGFTPGFPFLGGLNEKLHTPRLKTPRMAVPEGSVGIANNQTGMYPITSPGGWQIIGKTPLKLFAPKRNNPFLYKAGDKIKYFSISPSEYERMKSEEDNLWTE
ncbi:MAG: 5-oxoprolinase subunit PxpB [Desulfotignum sp.]|jgi:KipI family sensor histidine kinase inhibitor|nr:5-oxoprolinase subunit PxpB [Desulfotignum sp.]MCF8090754.1 5-oxoprolinase subunit PxpB [Desulfotignum sp.]